AHPLVGGSSKRKHTPLVRRRFGSRQEAQDQGPRVSVLLSARNPSQPPPPVGRYNLFRQLHPRRHFGGRVKVAIINSRFFGYDSTSNIPCPSRRRSDAGGQNADRYRIPGRRSLAFQR